MRTKKLLALLDAALVLVFAIAGRASHAEALDLAGIWTTAWPFLAALGVGWVIVAAFRWDPGELRTGTLLWAITVAGGMGIRVAAGGTTAVAFVLVAAATLASFLLGWRMLYRCCSGMFAGRGPT